MSVKTQIQQDRRLASDEAQRRRRGRTGSRPRAVALDLGAGGSPIWEVAGRSGALDSRPGSWRDTVLRRRLALSDLIATSASLCLVVYGIGGGSLALTPIAVLIAPFILICAKAIGLYDRDQYVLRKTTIDEVPAVAHLAILYSLVVWLTESVVLNGWLTRPEVFALLVASFGLLLCGRALVRVIHVATMPAERCIVVGSETDTRRFADKLDTALGVNAVIVARIALHPGEARRPDQRFPPSGSLSSPGALARAIAEHGAERVVVAPDGHDQEEILEVIRLIKALGVKVSVLPRLLEVVGSSSTYEDLDGMSMLGLRQYGVSQSSGALKRGLDLVVAGLLLTVLAPLFGLLALIVKCDSPGPILFRQRRIGREGRIFEMYKFRSMVQDAEAIKPALRPRNEVEGGLFKISDDPRITRSGRLLRRSSLDEIPQLLNVLRGSMSLVGPRPLVEDEDALIEGWGRRRLAVKPGMTGLWQIFGSSRIPMNEMVKIDYLYAANWSIWLDVKILLRTLPYVLRRRGL